jgi:hypothetical protein
MDLLVACLTRIRCATIPTFRRRPAVTASKTRKILLWIGLAKTVVVAIKRRQVCAGKKENKAPSPSTGTPFNCKR